MNIKCEKRAIELEYNLICDFIKLRHELGLTQKEMAEESGTIREIVGVLENRKKHPQINTLIKILEPFGYTLSITKIKEAKNERNSEKRGN
ncbi:MAG TPA: helix-turn-helix domain-containing protein [Bacilli bacterium]|nr:helix-turn-helix domain-containing protein [Bacilli bacterium]